jgi:hypothetical protein
MDSTYLISSSPEQSHMLDNVAVKPPCRATFHILIEAEMSNASPYADCRQASHTIPSLARGRKQCQHAPQAMFTAHTMHERKASHTRCGTRTHCVTHTDEHTHQTALAECVRLQRITPLHPLGDAGWSPRPSQEPQEASLPTNVQIQ